MSKNTIQVRQLVDSEQLKKDISYSLSDLHSAMMEQSSLAVHYGVLVASASRQLDNLKLLLEVKEAQVYRLVRDKATADGEKLTEAQLKAAVSSHPKIIAVRRAINAAKQVEATAKTAVEAFRQRRDMLVQHGLMAREEMKGEVSINRRNSAEHEREALEQRILNRHKTSSTGEI